MKPLTGKYAGIIYRGDDWTTHYGDKFRARRAVMLHAVQRGWTFSDCEAQLLKPKNPGSELWLAGEDGRGLTSAESAKRLVRDYEAVRDYARANPGYKTAADARARIGELMALADDWPWTRAAGRTDRDVLRFIHRAASRVGCDLINVSTRDIAIGAGVSQQTAGKSIRRLMGAGWLDKRQPAKHGLAPLFKLTEPEKLPDRIESYDLSSGESHMTPNGRATDVDHEVWLRLGKTAMDLCTVLEDTPISRGEASRRAGVAPTTARMNLPVLEACGLAARQGNGWIRLPVSLDSIAEAQGWTGTNSKRVRRIFQYQAERRAYRTGYR